MISRKTSEGPGLPNRKSCLAFGMMIVKHDLHYEHLYGYHITLENGFGEIKLNVSLKSETKG